MMFICKKLLKTRRWAPYGVAYAKPTLQNQDLT